MENQPNLPGISNSTIHPVLSSNLSFLSSLSTQNPVEETKKVSEPVTDIQKLTGWIEIPIKVLKEHCTASTTHPSEFVCPICREEYFEGLFTSTEKVDELNAKMLTGEVPIPVVRLGKCANHFFHKSCIENLASHENNNCMKCPVCGIIYGTLIGDMPPGHMSTRFYPKEIMCCEGYEDFGTIEIMYSIEGGVRNGVKFTGTHRGAYLPDIPEGREVLRLLKIAFERKLTFTVGTSTTSGKKNTVIWNGIHHKTAIGGGTKFYGYPDPTYFARVKEELAAKGVS